MDSRKIKAYGPVVRAVASMSKDRSTKVGAVILGPGLEIRSTGRNGFPRGVNDEIEARHERPEKYDWTAHAEENAIAHAARSGTSLDGCSLIVDGLYPCCTCTRMIINAGIRQVYVLNVSQEASARWAESNAKAQQMFAEAGVHVTYLNQLE